MKMKRHIVLICFLSLVSFSLYAQSEKKRVREGNDQFEEGNYSEAEINYRKALDEKPGYMKGTFNLGDAMYEQENFEESGKLFAEVAEGVHAEEQRAGAYYNLGNSLMKEQKYKESIEAYKSSLRLNPDDQDAKYNLAYAQKKLNEQQQQQQDQNQDQDNQDENKEEQDQKDQDKKDQEQQDQEQDQKDQNKDDQNKKEEGDQQKNQNQQPQPQQISKEDAQRMLEALKNDEKKTLQELQKQKAKAAKASKTDIDW